MNIESLELKLVKSSKIEDGDIIIVKIDDQRRKQLTKEEVKTLYTQITQMIKKDNIGIYFFPKNLDLEFIKNHVNNIESNKDQIEKQNNE